MAMANTNYYSLLVRSGAVGLAPINPLDSEGCCLSVLAAAVVVVAPINPHDESQQWYKANRVNDDEGNPSFALVNKVTHDALKRSSHLPPSMLLVRFDPANVNVDESVMWTEGGDVGEGLRSIGAHNNKRLHFVTLNDGTAVALRGWAAANESSQSWKIRPWVKTTYFNTSGDGGEGSGFSSEAVPTVRVFCKADEGLSATVRQGTVVLAATDPHDKHQHWIKDTRRINDEEGYQSFALVNNYSGDAMKHSQGEGFPVRLEHNPNYEDKSVMWTESRDMGGGFRCIRMVDNIHLNFSVAGTAVILEHSGCDHPVRPHYCPLCVLKRLAPHSGGARTIAPAAVS